MTIRKISGKRFSLEVRRATPDQAEALTQIAFAAKRYWDYPERWIQIWSSILTISEKFIEKHPTYLANVEGKPVGFYAISIEKDKAILEHLWILPGYMGQGIGKALFQDAFEQCEESGVHTLEIESDPNAQGFYERMGARKVSEKVGEVDGLQRVLPVLEIVISRVSC